MTDIVPSAKRSEMMAGIRGANTRPEIVIRRMLFALGYRFRLHRRDLPGTPDIAMPSRKVAIFVQGCFWHLHTGCRYSKMPATRQEFWKAKLERNAERDRESAVRLSELGWRVLCVWECATRDRELSANLAETLSLWIESDSRVGEISAQSLRREVTFVRLS
ncbi:DNA mismatch endonuclease Vsr [Achromobacter aegrifaciens]|uniref:very short patch repair endonuclease n=1 Tax=Achromobacter aegrifaciens TaxID=1287736 RepID=UPI0032092F59